MSKEITDLFARKVLECERAETGDIQFAYFLLQSKEAVNYEILMDYIHRKAGFFGEKVLLGQEEAFRRLEEILEGIRQGRSGKGRNSALSGGKMIVLD